MTHIQNTILIRRPLDEVFDYVTTPAKWVEWHPATVSISGEVDHPARVGEGFVEKIRFGVFRGEIDWVVVEQAPPHRWMFEGKIRAFLAKETPALITYQLFQREEGTLFQRDLVYTAPNRFSSFLDRLFMRRHNERESAEALEKLKAVLEK